MDLQVNKKNGESFTFEEHGVIVKDFIVSSIPLISNYSRVEGSDRQLDNGVDYGSRTIRVPIHVQAYDLADFPLLRDKLFSLVTSKESFYIREMRRVKKLSYAFVDTNEPARMDPDTDNRFVGGKRYLVRLQNVYELEQIEISGEGELIFETTELPFAESIGTTQDIHNNGINANDALWGFGMGLIADDDSLIYTHTGTSFKIYNAGDVSVHPFEQDLKITINNIQGLTSYFELRNITTGDLFRVNEGATGTIVLDGPNITRNNLNYLRETNKQYITLAPGWNEFDILGATSARGAFDFRFYYQ